MKKKLILATGEILIGEGFGDTSVDGYGELVFTTAMSGYQETLSDPSYTDQIISFSYPLIGNYGINKFDEEALHIRAKAIVVNELCEDIFLADNSQKKMSLSAYLKFHKKVGISNIDTRYLTKKLRNYGCVACAIVNVSADDKEVIQKLKNSIYSKHINKVSIPDLMHIPGSSKRVVVIDYGYKKSIISNLTAYDYDIFIVPFDTSKEVIDKIDPDGILLSNGPGNPSEYKESISIVKELIGKYKIFGICMGHEIYALANGGSIYKMKFGHRGINHCVKDLSTSKTYITSQNHGYCVKSTGLNSDVEASFIAVNDNTIEGLRNKKTGDFTVQFHPEANCGPNDTNFLFKKFDELMEVK